MSAREELAAALQGLDRSAPLSGPAPTWREGYDQDEPIYLSVVRAMGVPGLDGPTGGDVVQGQIQIDPDPLGITCNGDGSEDSVPDEVFEVRGSLPDEQEDVTHE